MVAIGCELQAIYADIIAQGVPDHFAALLRRLDEPTPAAASSAVSQHGRRDDGLSNGGDTHERLVVSSRRVLAALIFGLRGMVRGLAAA